MPVIIHKTDCRYFRLKAFCYFSFLNVKTCIEFKSRSLET